MVESRSEGRDGSPRADPVLSLVCLLSFLNSPTLGSGRGRHRDEVGAEVCGDLEARRASLESVIAVVLHQIEDRRCSTSDAISPPPVGALRAGAPPRASMPAGEFLGSSLSSRQPSRHARASRTTDPPQPLPRLECHTVASRTFGTHVFVAEGTRSLTAGFARHRSLRFECMVT